jgi:hypothetical protein
VTPTKKTLEAIEHFEYKVTMGFRHRPTYSTLKSARRNKVVLRHRTSLEREELRMACVALRALKE